MQGEILSIYSLLAVTFALLAVMYSDKTLAPICCFYVCFFLTCQRDEQ